MSSSSSSASVLYSASRRIQEENENPPALTGMNLEFQKLEEQIITATSTTTQLRNVLSIIDIVGCDITIKDIQSTKQELINQKFDLKKDVNKWQNTTGYIGSAIPLNYFCSTGNLLIIKLLFLIGANCTESCRVRHFFPMLVAAYYGHLDICKWLFEYGGDAKYQINKEISGGVTPLWQSYKEWRDGKDNEGKICRWLLLNGGGHHLSSEALRRLFGIYGKEETNSNLLVLWMREIMQYHDTFILLLCGARKRKIHQERSLQILDGHPGIMELIGNYFGLIRGKEIRMLQEFNKLVIEYNTTDEN